MIELEDVKAGYQERVRLWNICCRFEEGTITSIVGPNGSGKSTLLKTILGMTNRYCGEIFIDRKEFACYRRDELARKIAFLPQNRNVPWISVERMILHGRFPYLSYPRKYSEKDYELVERELVRFGLEKVRHQQLQELSGGERQKVYLAMAQVQDSPYYLFDEPTTYLDIAHQLEFLEQIRQLKEIGKTCIVVLHDLQAALTISDQILVLEKGRIVDKGDAGKLLQKATIDEVFGIHVKCIEDDEGKWYCIGK